MPSLLNYWSSDKWLANVRRKRKRKENWPTLTFDIQTALFKVFCLISKRHSQCMLLLLEKMQQRLVYFTWDLNLVKLTQQNVNVLLNVKKETNIQKCHFGFKHHLKLNVDHCYSMYWWSSRIRERGPGWHSRERLITYVCLIFQQTLEGARPSVKVTHIHRAAHQAWEHY